MFGFEKTSTYRYGDFTVIDRWITSDYSNASSGTTIILYEEVPIWFMTYSGQYPEKVIPFLKEVLYEQYKKKSFRGGRGPSNRSSDQFIYWNNSYDERGNLNFLCFFDREVILDRETKEELGSHGYFGMSTL